MSNATFLGFDISTTAVSVGVSDDNGKQGYASVPMQGATLWHGQPSFNLAPLPGMILDAFADLARQGWNFLRTGNLCASVRQHDMVMLGREGPLIPALSWQCNAATAEVVALQGMRAEEIVGKLAPRFVLPKAMKALALEPSLRNEIYRIMTTGDYMADCLTGVQSLSSSDALSNGLLCQDTKQLAESVIQKAGLSVSWFPQVIQSGTQVGVVKTLPDGNPWSEVAKILQGWVVKACLGDNHAGGVGSGLCDSNTVVLSFGSSGTVIRKSRRGAKLAGNAANFEYFSDQLLLMMLANCAVWYNGFLKEYLHVDGWTFDMLNEQALAADPGKLLLVPKMGEYPNGWSELTLAEQVASIQASIAIKMLHLVREMLDEVVDEDTAPITRFVLTGGLSQSKFLRRVVCQGLQAIVGAEAEVLASSQEGPLANKSAVLGALCTAMIGSQLAPSLTDAIDRMCPLSRVELQKYEGLSALDRFVLANL